MISTLFSPLNLELEEQKLLKIQPKMLFRIMTIIFSIVVIFEIIFWSIYSINHWIAGFFAVLYSVVLATRLGNTGLDKAIRLASIAGVGSAVMARSEYWFMPVTSNFKKLLSFASDANVQPWQVSSKPFVVLVIAVGFLVFYWLVSQWPELKNTRLKRNAMALSSVTQTIILISCSIPNVLSITAGILLGAVFTVIINKEFTVMSLLIASAAPFYAMSNTPIFVFLLPITGLILMYFLKEYEMKGKLRSATLAMISFGLIAPICFLSGRNLMIDNLVVFALIALSFSVHFIEKFSKDKIIEFVAQSVTLWYIILSLPSEENMFLVQLSLIMSLNLVLLIKNFNSPLQVLFRMLCLWFICVTYSPFLGIGLTWIAEVGFTSVALVFLISIAARIVSKHLTFAKA